MAILDLGGVAFGLGELFKFFPWCHCVICDPEWYLFNTLTYWTVVDCRRFLGLVIIFIETGLKVSQVARAFIDYPPYVDQQSSSEFELLL